jgi:phosphate starvation-inducible protein PhoH
VRHHLVQKIIQAYDKFEREARDNAAKTEKKYYRKDN